MHKLPTNSIYHQNLRLDLLMSTSSLCIDWHHTKHIKSAPKFKTLTIEVAVAQHYFHHEAAQMKHTKKALVLRKRSHLKNHTHTAQSTKWYCTDSCRNCCWCYCCWAVAICLDPLHCTLKRANEKQNRKQSNNHWAKHNSQFTGNRWTEKKHRRSKHRGTETQKHRHCWKRH